MINDNALRVAAMNAQHIGFCMSTYIDDECHDCLSEKNCLQQFLFDKEAFDKADAIYNKIWDEIEPKKKAKAGCWVSERYNQLKLLLS